MCYSNDSTLEPAGTRLMRSPCYQEWMSKAARGCHCRACSDSGRMQGSGRQPTSSELSLIRKRHCPCRIPLAATAMTPRTCARESGVSRWRGEDTIGDRRARSRRARGEGVLRPIQEHRPRGVARVHRRPDLPQRVASCSTAFRRGHASQGRRGVYSTGHGHGSSE